ncbi:MAG: type II toxin-antitoxin system VapC family toxin [Desulfamplus sp.]|nr:type II toxin-antitoxin system VapC family toxin [Desulfamplus sp.]
MKKKVYIETTIISYLAARLSKNTIIAGRQVLTQEWWDEYSNPFDLVVSELVFQEAGVGDPEVARKRINYINDLDSLAISDESVQLAEALVNEGVIPSKCAEDALHISVCAVNGIDFLLTWNCKHIANAVLRHRIESVIESQNYQCPVICTPAELMEDHYV